MKVESRIPHDKSYIEMTIRIPAGQIRYSLRNHLIHILEKMIRIVISSAIKAGKI